MTRARTVAFIAVVAIAVGLSAFFVTRNTRQEVRVDTAASPGFDGSDRGVDGSPFEFAEPTTTVGPTTIPGGRPTTRRATTTTTTTTTTTSTTTTTIPRRPILPDGGSITSVCGLDASITSLESLFIDPTLDVRGPLDVLVANLDRYVEVAEPEIREVVATIRLDIRRLAETIAAAGWQLEDAQVVLATQQIRSNEDPYQGYINRLQTLAFHNALNCVGDP